jgi:hypothetical protein
MGAIGRRRLPAGIEAPAESPRRRRAAAGAAAVRPPARRLRIDPHELVGVFEGGADYLLELVRGMRVAIGVLDIPAPFPPLVVHPQAEGGGEDLPVFGAVGHHGEDILVDHLAGFPKFPFFEVTVGGLPPVDEL